MDDKDRRMGLSADIVFAEVFHPSHTKASNTLFVSNPRF